MIALISKIPPKGIDKPVKVSPTGSEQRNNGNVNVNRRPHLAPRTTGN